MKAIFIASDRDTGLGEDPGRLFDDPTPLAVSRTAAVAAPPAKVFFDVSERRVDHEELLEDVLADLRRVHPAPPQFAVEHVVSREIHFPEDVARLHNSTRALIYESEGCLNVRHGERARVRGNVFKLADDSRSGVRQAQGGS